MKKEEKIGKNIMKAKNIKYLRLISFSVLVIVFTLIGSFKYPKSLNNNELSEIVIEDWMFSDTYFGENAEQNLIIENWMLNDNYFTNPDESEAAIEDWMLNDSYFDETVEEESIIENWMLDLNYFNN